MYTPAPVVFCDGEMTGLDDTIHDMWEFAAIVQGHRDPALDGEWLWQIQVDPDRFTRHADPAALEIGGFHDRYICPHTEVLLLQRPESAVTLLPSLAALPVHWSRRHFASHLVWLLGRADSAAPRTHWAGVVPEMDIRFITRLIRAVVDDPVEMPWHYQPVDCEAVAAGALGMPPPWDSMEISRHLGVTVFPHERHTALGDARWAKRIFDAAMALPPRPLP